MLKNYFLLSNYFLSDPTLFAIPRSFLHFIRFMGSLFYMSTNAIHVQKVTYLAKPSPLTSSIPHMLSERRYRVS